MKSKSIVCLSGVWAISIVAASLLVSVNTVRAEDAPEETRSYIEVTSVAAWLDAFVVAGYSYKESNLKRTWVAFTNGDTLAPLPWPPQFLNLPIENHYVRVFGTVNGRLAVVASAGRGEPPRSRLLFWDGVNWEAYPIVRGRIGSVAHIDGRVVIGGSFPQEAGVFASVMSWDTGCWCLLGDGLLQRNEDRWYGNLITYRGELVAHKLVDGEEDTRYLRLVVWRDERWIPFGPGLREVRQLGLANWGKRLVCYGSPELDDGLKTPGMIIIDGDKWELAPAPPMYRLSDASYSGTLTPQWEAWRVSEWNGRLVIGRYGSYTLPVLEVFDGRSSEVFPGTPDERGQYYVLDMATNGEQLAIVGRLAGMNRLLACPDEIGIAVWRDGRWYSPAKAPVVYP